MHVQSLTNRYYGKSNYSLQHMCHDVLCETRLKSRCKGLLAITSMLPGAYTTGWKLSRIQKRSCSSGPTTHPSLFRLKGARVLEPWRKEVAEGRAWVKSDEKHIAGASGGWCQFKKSISHTWMVLSAEPDMMCLPSGEIVTDRMHLVCPQKGAPTPSPVCMSHTRMVWSCKPDTMWLPSEKIATVLMEPVWPWRGVPNNLPVPISHTQIVLSAEPDTMWHTSSPYIPHLNCPVIRTWHYAISIWWNCDRSKAARVPTESTCLFSLNIPHLDCLVIWTRHDTVSARQDCNRLNIVSVTLKTKTRCRDSILYRLVLAYFTAHDHWASQCNITIMYPGHFPTLARCIPTLALSSHSWASSHSIAHLRVSPRIFAFHRASSRFTAHLRVSPRIFAFHRASSRFTAHLRVPSRIFAFHRNLVRIIAGASIHCPANSLVHHIPFITISDYVWHHTIIISLWTLTLHHLHP
jgi:hypothetical protein